MIAEAILLYFLSLQVNGSHGLITSSAKCIRGYDWMFSSIGQSPCDVAAELASVCIGIPLSLVPIDVGWQYAGPSKENNNNCNCSSVYYSLLSGCAYCQGRSHIEWSRYITNCSTPFLTVYKPTIPFGVRVPAYAYLDVSISDSFNVTLAQSVKGVESSRPPVSSTSTSYATPSGPSGNGTRNQRAIVGGVVGGIVGLGLSVLASCLLLRKLKLKSRAYNRSQLNSTGFVSNTQPAFPPMTPPPAHWHAEQPHNQIFQQNPNGFIVNTTASVMPPPPVHAGSSEQSQTRNRSSQLGPNRFISNTTAFPPMILRLPGSSEKLNDLSKYSPSMNNPYLQHSPPFRVQNLTPELGAA